MKSRVALLCLLVAACDVAVAAPGEHPLLELARELESARHDAPAMPYFAADVRAAEHALDQAHPPPDDACARSLGAAVFADLHSDVAAAREDRGDFAGAALAWRRALACSPRNATILGDLAESLFHARDLAAARQSIALALAIEPRDVQLVRLAGRIDFVEERWADAVSRLRYVAASEADRVSATHAQLLYLVAQLRAGVVQPQPVARRHAEGWPKPLLDYLLGGQPEVELVAEVRAGDFDHSDASRDHRLCEALYYVGEAWLAHGKPAIARDYFAAAVNVKMTRLAEHGLALAEIAKLSGLRP